MRASRNGDIKGLRLARDELATGAAVDDSLVVGVEQMIKNYYVERALAASSRGEIDEAIEFYQLADQEADLSADEASRVEILKGVIEETDHAVDGAGRCELEAIVGPLTRLESWSHTNPEIGVSEFFAARSDGANLEASLDLLSTMQSTLSGRERFIELLDVDSDLRADRREVLAYCLLDSAIQHYRESVIPEIDFRLAEDRVYAATVATKGRGRGLRYVLLPRAESYRDEMLQSRALGLPGLYAAYRLSSDFEMGLREVQDRIATYMQSRLVGPPSVVGDGDGLPDFVVQSVRSKIIDPSTACEALLDFGNWDVSVSQTVDRTVTSRYRRGQKTIPNDEYYRLKELEVQYVNEYNRQVSNPPSTDSSAMGAFAEGTYLGLLANARRKVSEVRAMIAMTPQTLIVDEFVPYQFSEKQFRLDGHVSVHAIVRSGESIFDDKAFKVAVDETYVFRDGVRSDDPDYEQSAGLSIPSEDTVSLWMALDISDQIEAWLVGLRLVDIDGEIKTVRSAIDDVVGIDQRAAKSFLTATTTSAPTVGSWETVDRRNLQIDSARRSFPDTKAAVKYAKAATYRVTSFNDRFDASSGTAYLIDSRGMFITNNHVVEGNRYHVLHQGGREVYISEAEVLAAEGGSFDLAVLRADIAPLNPVCVAVDFSASGELGDGIFYVGFPGGPIDGIGGEFFGSGMISQVVGGAAGPDYYVLDVTANQGASGSAILHEESGLLVGTLSWGFGRSIDLRDLQSIIEGGHISIKESQNVCTSVGLLARFLKESGFDIAEGN